MPMTFLARASSVAAFLLILTPAHAQIRTDQGTDVSKSCEQGLGLPAPYGESDLKGNAKFPAYCKCFMSKFEVRAMKAAKYMQANPGKAPPGTLEQSNAEELEMRNSCRKQFGLPQVVLPK